MAEAVDGKDRRILAALTEDARRSTQAIADAVGLPRVTVHDRIRRLQERGVIVRFTVELGREPLGQPLHAFILATFDPAAAAPHQRDRRQVARAVAQLDPVVTCHLVTGAADFMIEVVASSMDALGDFILDELGQLVGLAGTQTMVSFYDYEGPSAALR